jgi:hypothetical protein
LPKRKIRENEILEFWRENIRSVKEVVVDTESTINADTQDSVPEDDEEDVSDDHDNDRRH